MQKEFKKCENRTKKIISEIVFNTNLIERKIKEIISNYIGSKNDYFIMNILLNSLFLNISSKVRVLEYIIKYEKIKIDSKKLANSLRIVMGNRNIIVHSDSILSPDINVDVGYEYLSGEGDIDMSSYIIYQPVQTIKNSELRYDDIEKIYADFNKHFEIVFLELTNIASVVEGK